jgi:transcriptional regulator with XRE-family HTH domain
MPRRPLSTAEKNHGRQLGKKLSEVREELGKRAQDVAVDAKLSVDTLRSIESGRLPTPAFLTVARIAAVLNMSLDQLHRDAGGNPA